MDTFKIELLRDLVHTLLLAFKEEFQTLERCFQSICNGQELTKLQWATACKQSFGLPVWQALESFIVLDPNAHGFVTLEEWLQAQPDTEMRNPVSSPSQNSDTIPIGFNRSNSETVHTEEKIELCPDQTRLYQEPVEDQEFHHWLSLLPEFKHATASTVWKELASLEVVEQRLRWSHLLRAALN